MLSLNKIPNDIQNQIYLYMFDIVMNEFKKKFCSVFNEYYDYTEQKFIYYERVYHYDTMYYCKYTDFTNLLSIYYRDNSLYDEPPLPPIDLPNAN